MRAPGLTWAGVISGAVAFNLYRDSRRDGTTLCSQTRRLFRTNTPAGRWAFRLAWGAFSRWLVPHLVYGPMPAPPDTLRSHP